MALYWARLLGSNAAQPRRRTRDGGAPFDDPIPLPHGLSTQNGSYEISIFLGPLPPAQHLQAGIHIAPTDWSGLARLRDGVICGSGLPAFNALNMAMRAIITMPPFSAAEISNSICDLPMLALGFGSGKPRI
jgi:hypothetical protein